MSVPGAPDAAPRPPGAAASGPVVLVSACLLGVRCRHDGRTKPDPALRARLPGATLVPVCPEEAGGLPTPRPAAQLRGGDGPAVLDGRARVVAADGTDVTAAFVAGAMRAVALANATGATAAWLTERSPSCGARGTWVDGRVVAGEGVTTAALRRAGVAVDGVGDPRLPAADGSPGADPAPLG